MTRTRWTQRLLLGAIVLALAVIAYLLLWTTYMVYDDEGYVLYSLRAYCEHGHLYDQVYTQYGPFFYVFYRGLHALGLGFTNTTGRALALVCWIGAALLCGRLVWQATRGNLLASILTICGAFVQLWPMAAEPSHPGGLIALLVAIVACFGIDPRLSASARAAVIGCGAGMLLLTKVNVGVFLVASVAVWWALSRTDDTRPSLLRWGAAAAVAIVPVGLMQTLFAEAWVKIFVAVIAAGAVAAVLVAESNLADRISAKSVVRAIVAAALVVVVTIVSVLLSGTTVPELLEGVILGPLRHPTIYTAPFTWQPGTLLLTWSAVPLALWLRGFEPKRRATIVFIGRGLLAAGYVACATGIWRLETYDFVLTYGITTAWLFVMRVRSEDSTHAVRGWLALLLVLQALHAYPVAGSQVTWGTFLWVPLAALGLCDVAAALGSLTVRRVAAVGFVLAALLSCSTDGFIGWWRYRESGPLDVYGAKNLRLPEEFSSAIRMIVENSRTHADMLFSLPGMMSLNLWSQLPPPTVPNATHWFNLLTREQQNQILQRLRASPRSALIVQRAVYDFLHTHDVPVDSPLVQWLFAHYQRVFTADTYEFWVRKGRRIEPVNAVRLFKGASGAITRCKLEITLNAAEAKEIASLELDRFSGNGVTPVHRWNNNDAILVVIPIAEDGSQTSEGAKATFPFTVRHLVKIDLFTDAFPSAFNPRGNIIYLRDARGAKIGEARFIN